MWWQMQTGVTAWGPLQANWKEVDNAVTDKITNTRAIDQNNVSLVSQYISCVNFHQLVDKIYGDNPLTASKWNYFYFIWASFCKFYV